MKKRIDNDDKKIMVSSDLAQKNLFLRIYFTLMNKKNQPVRLIFIGLVFSSVVEDYFDSWTDLFMVHFSISLVFTVPLLVIIIEYEEFLKIFCLFEMKVLMVFKAIILFKQKMEYFEALVFVLTLCAPQIVFTKALFINETFLGQEIQNRNEYKMNIFVLFYPKLMMGYFCNTAVLLYLFYTNKLSFFLYDDLFPSCHQKIYYIFFIYLANRKLLSYLNRVSNSKIYYDKVKNSRVILISLILIQVVILFVLSGFSMVNTLAYLIIASAIILLYENIGFFTYLVFILFYLGKLFFVWYMENHYNDETYALISKNAVLVTFSYIISGFFLKISYYLSDHKSLIKTHKEIILRIFYYKILFDSFLIVNYIYKLYKNSHQTYYEDFINTYHIIFLCFAGSYLLVFLGMFFKLNFFISEDDVNSTFENVKEYIDAKKSGENIVYGEFTPYLEIKFYRLIKGICDNFKAESLKDKNMSSSYKKVSRLSIIMLFVFVSFIVNNSLLFYFIYLVIIQFMIGSVDFVRKAVQTLYSWYWRKKHPTIYYEKIKPIPKGKYKLIYVVFYPYLVLVYKLVIVKLFMFLYEVFFAKVMIILMGRLEPVTNVIYQMMRNNDKSSDLGLVDGLVMIIFILPTSVNIIYCYIKRALLSMFFQVFLVFSLIGVFLPLSVTVTMAGFINIIVMLFFSALDEETYENFAFFFDLWGIYSD